MLIAILSDVHDHIPNLRAALGRIAEHRSADGRGVEALVCCGDLCSPFVVDELARGFAAGAVYVVFGNNDGDRFRITLRGRVNRRVEVRGESAALEVSGRRIFVHHFDDVGGLVAEGGRFDLVCYGHNHECRRRTAGGSLAVNPGAIMGWHPRQGEIRPTYAVYDTDSGAAEIYDARSGAPATDWCAEAWPD